MMRLSLLLKSLCVKEVCLRLILNSTIEKMLLKYEVIEWGEPLRASLKTETKGFDIIDTLFFLSNFKRY